MKAFSVGALGLTWLRASNINCTLRRAKERVMDRYVKMQIEVVMGLLAFAVADLLLISVIGTQAVRIALSGVGMVVAVLTCTWCAVDVYRFRRASVATRIQDLFKDVLDKGFGQWSLVQLHGASLIWGVDMKKSTDDMFEYCGLKNRPSTYLYVPDKVLKCVSLDEIGPFLGNLIFLFERLGLLEESSQLRPLAHRVAYLYPPMYPDRVAKDICDSMAKRHAEIASQFREEFKILWRLKVMD